MLDTENTLVKEKILAIRAYILVGGDRQYKKERFSFPDFRILKVRNRRRAEKR